MEYPFEKTEIPFIACAARENQMQELTQEVRLNDGMPDVGRVISSFGQVVIRSKEWGTGAAGVAGGVMASVLYAPEDGSEVRNIESWIPFQMQWSIPETERDGTLAVVPMLRFMDCRMSSARKMMIRAGVAISLEASYPSQICLYQPSELPEGTEILNNTIDARIPKEAGEKTFSLDEEIRVPESENTPMKMLFGSLTPVVSECRVMTDKVVFRGNGQLHFLYKGEDGRVSSQNREIPFSVFAELSGSYSQNANANIQTIVTGLELDSSNNGIVHVKCGLVAQYLVNDVVRMEGVEDLYSTKSDIIPHFELCRYDTVSEDRRVLAPVEVPIPGINGSVIDAITLQEYPQYRSTESGINLEHSGTFKVLYYDQDNLLQSAGSSWSAMTPVDLNQECELAITGYLPWGIEADAGEQAIRLTANVQTDYKIIEHNEIPMAIGFERAESGNNLHDRPSLIICKPGENRLWDLAKQYRSTVSDIQRTNGIGEGEVPDVNTFLLIPVAQS